MDIYNIHEAKTHLSRLVEKAARGEPFVIARAGKPLVKVVPIQELPAAPVRRIGFLKGVYAVPDDFKAFGREEIEEMFHGTKG